MEQKKTFSPISSIKHLREIRKNYSYIPKLIETYGKNISFNLLFMKVFLLVDPTDIENVLIKKDKIYYRSKLASQFFEYFLGENSSLLSNDYDFWLRNRRILIAYFSGEKLKEHCQNIVEVTNEYLKKWDEHATNDQPLHVTEAVVDIIFHASIKTVFGNIHFDAHKLNELIKEIREYSLLSKFFCLNPILIFKKRKLKNQISKIGDQIVTQSLSENANPNNIIKALFNEYYHGKMSRKAKKHLHSDALYYSVLSNDTTAGAVAWALIYITLHPLVAEKIVNEIKINIGDRNPTFDDLKNLPYIRAVFLETLRLQPALYSLIRKASEKSQIGGNTVSKGDWMYIDLYHLHRLPQFWENPEDFNPERFLKPLDENKQKVYIPFSEGPHSCLGKNLAIAGGTIALCLIMKKYRLSMNSTTKLELEESINSMPNKKITMHIRKASEK